MNPAEYLNEWQREIYLDYGRRVRLPRREWPAVTGKPCHLLSEGDELVLVKRLLRNGMATLIPRSTVHT